MAYLAEPVTDHDHILGPATAPTTLVEYGDYECPYCGAAHPVVEKVRQRLGDRLRFVFRHFPLTGTHPHAEHAAEAAEAMGVQGHFWTMHNLLFEHQRHLDDENLERYAQMAGADMTRFVREFTTHVYVPRIRHDLETGLRSGVNGTPTFFINGLRYDGVPDVASLTLAIETVQAH